MQQKLNFEAVWMAYSPYHAVLASVHPSWALLRGGNKDKTTLERPGENAKCNSYVCNDKLRATRRAGGWNVDRRLVELSSYLHTLNKQKHDTYNNHLGAPLQHVICLHTHTSQHSCGVDFRSGSLVPYRGVLHRTEGRSKEDHPQHEGGEWNHLPPGGDGMMG